MKLEELYNNTQQPIISYEVFPPKDDFDNKKTNKLFEELTTLKRFNPSLISVTYGAGGSNKNQSIDIIKRIKDELGITPMPHFTCVSTNKANIKKYLKEIEMLGIKNILALRGDIPTQGQVFDDFKHASELVAYIKKETKLSVAVAGYPEGHIDAESLEKDIFYLKEKVNKGADVIYTQLFFNNDCFYEFLEKCTNQNITKPIIPGIMPITSYKSIQKMLSLCNIDIPKEVSETIEKHKNDNEYIKKFGVEYATRQCENLIKNNIKGLHFYTLNKAQSVKAILENINIG